MSAIYRLWMALLDHPELAGRLGREPDRELAEAYRVSMSTVKTWRKHAGCPEAPRSPSRVAPPVPDERLGTVPDRVLAAEHGITHQAIAYRRQARGIPPYRPDPVAKFAGVIDQLGVVSDLQLAKDVGVSGNRRSRTRGTPHSGCFARWSAQRRLRALARDGVGRNDREDVRDHDLGRVHGAEATRDPELAQAGTWIAHRLRARARGGAGQTGRGDVRDYTYVRGCRTKAARDPARAYAGERAVPRTSETGRAGVSVTPAEPAATPGRGG